MKVRTKIVLALTILAILPLLITCSLEQEEQKAVPTMDNSQPVPSDIKTPNYVDSEGEFRKDSAGDTGDAKVEPSTNLVRFVAVSSGGVHTCALRDDGTAVCWGTGTTRKIDGGRIVHLGQAIPPQDEQFVALSSGSLHTCGLREDGRVVCWGAQGDETEYDRGQASPPPDERFIAISSGDAHTCGLREDGRAVCWGDDGLGKSTPPEGERFKAIASGGPHTCGLRMDSTAVCWGQEPGLLRGGPDGWSETPPWEFTALEAAGSHTCGRHPNGIVQCWGHVSDAGSPGRYPPTKIDGLPTNLKTFSVEGWHGCGLKEDDYAYCWGYRLHPYPKDQRFSDISAGGDHTCAIRKDNGSLVCWGNNEYGQASPPDGERFVWSGGGSTPNEPFPPYIDVSAGSNHTCALRADGAALCWGAGKPVDVFEDPAIHLDQSSPPSDGRFLTISSSTFHTCGLRIDGKAVCWGAQREGFPGSIIPRQMFGQANPPPEERFVEVSSGWRQTCGLRRDGSATCWGNNRRGQLLPPEGERFKAIATGMRHNCGLRLDGTVLCWGFEPDPNGLTLKDETPEGKFSMIDASGDHTCGLRLNGQVKCWGYWEYVPAYDEYPPAHIDGGLSVISIGGTAGCGLRSDGSPFCWGHLAEYDYPSEERFSHISVAYGHACAIRMDDGDLVCWGRDSYGEATPPVGETTSRETGG